MQEDLINLVAHTKYVAKKYGLSYQKSADMIVRKRMLLFNDYNKIMDNDIVSRYMNILGLKDGSRRLGMFFQVLYECWKADKWLVIFRDKKHKNAGMEYQFFIKNVVNKLVEQGDLTQHIGFKAKKYIKMNTRVKASGALLRSFYEYDQNVINVKGEKLWIPCDSLVILKDHNKEEVSLNSKNRQYRNIRSVVNTVNSTIMNADVSIKGIHIKDLLESQDNANKELIELIVDYCNRQEGPPNPYDSHYMHMHTASCLEVLQSKYLCDLERFRTMSFRVDDFVSLNHHFWYTRIFNLRIEKGVKPSLFSNGGRFYCKGSAMPKSFRRHICIRNSPTIEVDFKSIHPSIIAIEMAQDANLVPYDDENLMFITNNRSFHKKSINALINCKTKKQAYSYMDKALKEIDSLIHGSTYIDLLLTNFPWFENYIGTDSGVRFQNIDSDIAANVMKRYINETGLPILCWHDSFRVIEEHEELLHQIMQEESAKILGQALKTETL
jgi:hypothetical protein